MIPQPLKQELIAPVLGGYYQGTSVVAGTYKGKAVLGTARAEQLGSQ